ncbi:unnamed protein product, partial [Coregonus sp. 'balchen']
MSGQFPGFWPGLVAGGGDEGSVPWLLARPEQYPECEVLSHDVPARKVKHFLHQAEATGTSTQYNVKYERSAPNGRATVTFFSDAVITHSCTPKTIGCLAREVALFSEECNQQEQLSGSVASEVTAVMALRTSMEDMTRCLARMMVAYSRKGNCTCSKPLDVFL